MSGKRSGKSLGGRALDALSLSVLFALVYGATRGAPGLRGDASMLGALGFLLLAGTLMSELVEVLGIPHLTGYLCAGILAGPHLLHFVDHEAVQRLEVVNSLALALIALSGGAELELGTLRRGLRSLAYATFFQNVVVVLGTGLVFVLVRPGFVREMPLLAVFGVALLWGVLATARSPSALLGVISQTRASGPVSRFSLQFILTSDIVVVILLAAAVTAARPLVDAGATISGDAFVSLAHDVVGAVALGTTIGLALAAYLKIVGKQLLVVLIGLGFGVTEVLHYLHLEPLLTFMVAGFVVRNLSQQGEKFLHAIEETGGVVYVIFFAGAGAHLNVPLLREYWAVALLLTASRALITWGANRLSSQVARDVAAVRQWGWSALVSQAGIAIGIAQLVAREFPTFGPSFRDIAIACVAINELVGPVLFKLALDRSGETKAPSPSLGDAEEAA